MWNGQSIQAFPNWSGIKTTSNTPIIPSNNLIVSSIQTNYISTAVINVSSIIANNISSTNGNINNLNIIVYRK